MATQPTYSAEIARQERYLDRLPENYTFPLFNSKQALMSQRRNGYRNTAVAGREIVDNAIEAGAANIDVILHRAPKTQKHQRKDTVAAIAFVDDGSGMIPEMARYALSWGGGTHWDDHDLIGKFGFGLPNASINQTRRVSVYSRVEGSKHIYRVTLDIDDFAGFEQQSIPEPEQDDLPQFVAAYLKKQGRTFEHGTVVVWESPDRLTYKQAGSLRPHIVDDFGTAYRNFLGKVSITVDGTPVERVDPLFLDPKGKYFVPEKKGGAIESQNHSIPVVYFRDLETGGTHLKKVSDEDELEDSDAVEILSEGIIQVIVARFPYKFVVKRKKDAPSEDARRRFQVRQSRRGMSFVRAGREIDTVDAFPRSANDIASGLGKWPLLQGYAYHWAVEVRFDPRLDEAFGITNDKQTVRPIEDFWRTLSQEGVDTWLNAENTWQRDIRRDARKKEAAKKQKSDKPTRAQTAAAAAEVASGDVVKPPKKDEAAQSVVDKTAEERAAAKTGKSKEEIRKLLRDQRKRQPFVVEIMDEPRGPFYEPAWGPSNQVRIRLNKAHPFFDVLYTESSLADGESQVKDSIDLLLFALSKSELTAEHEETKAVYVTQREDKWSRFLHDALSHLIRQSQPEGDVDEDSEADDVLEEA